jgi:hypothetical protein
MALGSAGAATAASVVGPALVRQLRRERSAPA